MSANNTINKTMTMNGGGNVLKGMEGYWSVKPKKRDVGSNNRKHPATAKQKARHNK